MPLLGHLTLPTGYFGGAVSTGGQVGSPGAQSGIGSVAVADWWLANGLGVEEETDAAATPAKTIERAKMRMANLMVGNLFQ
jgi:hypothetical protein